VIAARIMMLLTMTMKITLIICRDLLLPGDLSTTTLEERRQQWLEAAPNLSLTGKEELEGASRTYKPPRSPGSPPHCLPRTGHQVQ
jgi:hypothetical protein